MLKKLLIIFLFLAIGCSTKPQEGQSAGPQEKEPPKIGAPAPAQHQHKNRKEQASCAICNARLLMEKGYREIDVGKLSELIKNNEPFILVNVLPPYYYRREHIPNSINIPKDDLPNIAPKILKTDAKIIVYCLGYECKVSPESAEKLVVLGFTNVTDFKGGMEEWKSAGNSVSGILANPPPAEEKQPQP